MASEFIVLLPSGRKSKPASREKILEMHLMGRIPNGATVSEVGSEAVIPIDEFISQKEAVRPTPAADSFIEPAEVPTVRQDIPEIGQSTFRPFTPLVRQREFSLTDGFFAVVLAILRWPFRGLIIPTRGANETRDYLRRNLVWLEVVLFLMHLCTLLVLFFFGFGLIIAINQSIDEVGRSITLLGLIWRCMLSMHMYLIVLIVLMVLEALLRLIPAALRYWIEVTEERRRNN